MKNGVIILAAGDGRGMKSKKPKVMSEILFKPMIDWVISAVKEAETDITRIEEEIASIEAEIAGGNVDNDIFTRHQAMNKQLENAMSIWELATMELEELKQEN